MNVNAQGQNFAAPPDEELIRLARRGDHDAFGKLVARYERQVAATVIGMLGTSEEVEDVGQETFINFYGALDRFRGESTVGTYLTRIAINLSLKSLARRRTWMKRFVSTDEAELQANVADASHRLESAERVDTVRRAIATLKPDHRAVVVLRMINGYSTKETAELLGVPPGTVMSRLSRAMNRLGNLLEPFVADQEL